MFGRHFIAEPPEGYAATQATATPTQQVLPEHEVAFAVLVFGSCKPCACCDADQIVAHSQEDRRKQELKALTVSGPHAKTFTFGQKHH